MARMNLRSKLLFIFLGTPALIVSLSIITHNSKWQKLRNNFGAVLIDRYIANLNAQSHCFLYFPHPKRFAQENKSDLFPLG
ncbi:hypothetical protein HI914_02826 [Erysiphe necator]|nr:hypothetical protein HI914_02826 [Erysiphe necator]